ncbi:MAG TPA: AGE family epimerase/isomerase [Candidatus Didemnitutus sp.]|nr:AGE family epimerase/isomerase [Candidatus Didemnitutus sp.]
MLTGVKSPATPAVSTAELHALAQQAETELRGNILPFWLAHARDREHGGFHGLIDADMKVHSDAPRGALLTSRILWTFSAAYRKFHDPAYLAMAQWAYGDLENFRDKEHGGLFWTITADGKPLSTQKLIYGQVFGIYALAEYFRATGDKAALEQAIAIYRLVEVNAHDQKFGGYFDYLTRDWKRTDPARKTPLGEAPKSQNSHIHIMEAYTNLLRAWPDDGLKKNQRELIELMMAKIVDAKTHHLVLFMKEDWTPVSDDISYGHDIELSWLLVEAAEELGNREVLIRAKTTALAIAETTATQGVDLDGGVFNEGNAHGLTDTNKDWWSQAEAAVGFLNAYQLTGDRRWFEASERSWKYIQSTFVDRKNGDWFERVTREGVAVPRPRLSVWKCPYHNSRSCLELIERVEALAK